MEEMVNRLFEALAKQTERAVRAEDLAEALRVNIDKLQSDVEYWKGAYFKKAEQLEKLEKENADEHI